MYKFVFLYEILYRCKGALYNKGNRRISIMHSVTSDPSILAMTTVMNYKPLNLKSHFARDVSFPVQSTSFIHICPLPAPKCAKVNSSAIRF